MTNGPYWYELTLGERSARRLAKLTGISVLAKLTGISVDSDAGAAVEDAMVKKCFMIGLREMELQRGHKHDAL